MVSVKEKIAYGLGDTASNIVFQTVMLFLTFFIPTFMAYRRPSSAPCFWWCEFWTQSQIR